jgi:CRP-like cAMP-binding protein
MVFSETDISLLRSCALLMPEALFDDALRCSENQLRVDAGVVLLKAGTAKPGLHLLAHGTVEMIVLAPDGGEKIIDFARTGGLFAEETLFDAQPLRIPCAP